MTFESYAEEKTQLFNDYIERSLVRFRGSVSQRFSPLIDAMQYSLEGGGKRLRPLLVMGSAEFLGLKAEDVLPAAAAIEYVHTYSLVHDDLPALDDDDTRRGKPASHIKFGEAVAILAGDALLTEAFGQIMHLQDGGRFNAHQILGALDCLVQYGGVRGMVGGQLLDVTTDPLQYNLPEVEFIHIHKTGALILASVLLPSRLIPVEEERLQRLRRYGEAIGLAFQISDDLLDSEALIRYSRGPRKKPKPSYAHVMSPSEMKEKLCGLTDSAIRQLEKEGGRGEALRSIAKKTGRF